MNLDRYLTKKAAEQVKIAQVDGQWQLQYTVFDTETGAALEAGDCRKISPEQLAKLREETMASIQGYETEIATFTAAKTRQEEYLVKLDTLIGDLQAALKG